MLIANLHLAAGSVPINVPGSRFLFDITLHPATGFVLIETVSGSRFYVETTLHPATGSYRSQLHPREDPVPGIRFYVDPK